MENQGLLFNPEKGAVHYSTGKKDLNSLPWSKHPVFQGVFLKHLIKGKDTNNSFSAHFVKVEPGACLEIHIHENQIELHEVIDGYGVCELKGEKIEYQAGKMAVIHKGEEHKVKAGEKGLIIAAKFFPALV